MSIWDEKKKVIEMRKAGMSYQSISEQFDSTVNQVRKLINFYAPELSNIGCGIFTKLDLPVQEIVKLRKLGWSKKQIAFSFHCCKETIKSRFDEHKKNTGESLSGYIKPTLGFPEDSISKLKEKGKSLWDVANESNCSVVNVVHKLNSIESNQG